MGIRGLRLAAFIVIAAGAAMAQAPDRSPRPEPRPVIFGTPPQDLAATVAPAAAPAPAPAVPEPAPAVAPAAIASAVVSVPRPRPRPWAVAPGSEAPPPQLRVTEVAAAPAPAATAAAAAEPQPKPKRGLARLFGAAAAPRVDPGRPLVEGRKGAICGDPGIRGEVLAPIKSKVKGCGVPDPVRVTEVDGIRLSQPATVDCETAVALKTWVQKAVKPTFGRNGVVELKVAAHYICRPRNNVRGAKISEHGRGKAIDISGFVLASGREITVAQNYRGNIREVHKAACGIFGTTLGPGSDGYHEDHLHLDTASQRNGPYCR